MLTIPIYKGELNNMATFGTILMILLIVAFTWLAIYMLIKVISEIKDIRYYKKHGVKRPQKQKKKKENENVADE